MEGGDRGAGKRPSPWPERLARAVAPLLAALLALRTLQAIPAHSLWLDEWATLEGAFAPTSVLERLYTLSGPAAVNFPTFYVLTRLLGGPLAFAGQSLEAQVRLPATLLTLAGLALAVRWALAARSPVATWLAAGLVGILLAGGDWALHAGEGRVYALLGTLTLAMVLAAAHGRPGAACACGLGVALLHPFGALVGFAPALGLLVGARLLGRERLGLDARAVRRTAWAAGAVLAVAFLWVQMKFIGHQTGGYGLRRRGGDMGAVLRGLDPLAALLLAAAALAGLLLAWRAARRGGRGVALPRWTLAALTGGALAATLGLGAAALALVRPGVNVAVPRYVAWIDPALYAGAAAGLALLAAPLARRLAARAPRLLPWAALAGALAAGAWSFHLLRTVPLGPPWGDGLREAARHLEVAVGERDAVVTDMRALFKLFPPHDQGHACPRSPQLVPYLSPALRARLACQGPDGRVTFGPGVERVFLVREPVAVTEGRVVVLDGFEREGEVRFANTTVERYRRAAAR
jgi:hypothetical protein